MAFPRTHTIFRWITRLLLLVVGVYLALFLAVVVVLHSPAVQNWLLPKATKALSEALGVEVRLAGISLKPFTWLSLDGFAMDDERGELVFSVEALQLNMFDLPTLAWMGDKNIVRTITLGSLHLQEPYARICTRSDGTSNLDFLSSEDTTETELPKMALSVGQLSLKGGQFIYIDSTLGPEGLALHDGHLNYGNLHLRGIDLLATFNYTADGDVLLDLDHLCAFDPRVQFALDTLRTNLVLARTHNWAPDRLQPLLPEPPYTQLQNTRIVMGRTRLHFDLLMPEQTMETLFATGENRRYDLQFHSSRLDFASINSFLPESTLPLHGVLDIDGPVNGDYISLRARGLSLGFGQHSRLTGNFSLRNYTDAERLFLDLNLQQSRIHTADVRRLLPGMALPKQLARLTHAGVQGRFTGFLTDFVANADLQLPMGSLSANMNIKQGRADTYTYSGQLITRNLDLDSLLGQKVSRRLNIEAQIIGNTAENFEDLEIQGAFRMFNSELGGYALDTVTGNAQLLNKQLEAQLNVQDRHGNFDGRVAFDWQNEVSVWKMVGDVEDLNLNHYGVLDDTVKLTTVFNVDVSGDSLDNLEGTVRLFLLTLTDSASDQSVQINDLVMYSRGNTRQYKSMRLRGAPLDLRMEGAFSYQQLPGLFRRLGADTRQMIAAQPPDSLRAYFARKPPVTDTVKVNINLLVRDADPLLHFFNPEMHISSGARLTGNFSFGETEEAMLNFSAKELHFGNTHLDELEGSVDIRKQASAPDLQASAQITADNLSLPGGITFQNLNLTPSWQQDRIAFNLTAMQEGIRNFYLLSGAVRLKGETITLRMDAENSRILIGEQIWSFTPGNVVRIGNESINIENLALYEGEQRIEIASRHLVSQNKTDLSVQLKQVDLQIINHFLQSKSRLSGSMNMRVVAKDLFNDMRLSGGGTVHDFSYKNITYGDFSLDTYWNNSLTQMAVQAQLVNNGDSVLSLDGHLAPTADDIELYLKLTTERLRLNKLQPFLDKVVTKLDGEFTVTDLFISGTATQPRMRGKAELENATARVNYLGAQYYIPRGQIRFDADRIKLDSIAVFAYQDTPNPLYDRKAAQTRVNGHISLANLENPSMNITLENFTRFPVFDLRSYQNSAFYGKAFIRSGKATLSGYADAMKLTAKITPARGTDVYIPAASGGDDQRLDFVRFIGADIEDDTEVEELPTSTFEMELNLDVTPDARISLVFDERTGDVISARGQGSLRMLLTKEEEFFMYGSVEIQEGNYLFTYGNVAAKPFMVDPGGRLSWDGSPYNGTLNLNAVYRVENASLAAWDTTAASTRVDVLMSLQGSIESPDIQFGIRIPNLNQQQTFRIISTLNLVRNDVQELNRQVFSLILMHRVAPVGGFFMAEAEGMGGNFVTTSVSEFLSTQMTSWLNNSLGNELDINLMVNPDGTLGANATARLFNDKVTVRRNGAVAGSAQRDVSLGNISIEIKLYPTDSTKKENPGRLGVEIFNRENIVTNTLAATNRGVGVFYRKDFDRLADLIGPNRKAVRNRNSYLEVEHDEEEILPGEADTPALEQRD